MGAALVELRVIDRVVDLLSDHEAKMNSVVCGRALEFLARAIEAHPTKVESSFVTSGAIEAVMWALGLHDSRPEVVGWGLAILAKALMSDELKGDIKARNPNVTFWMDYHRNRPEINQVGELVLKLLA